MTNSSKSPFTRDRFTWLAYLLLAFYTFLEAALGPLMPFLRAELALNYTCGGLHFSAFALGGPPWLVIGSIGVHGFIFTFFFIGLVIAVEELSEPEYRASAQGLLTFKIMVLVYPDWFNFVV